MHYGVKGIWVRIDLIGERAAHDVKLEAPIPLWASAVRTSVLVVRRVVQVLAEVLQIPWPAINDTGFCVPFGIDKGEFVLDPLGCLRHTLRGEVYRLQRR